MVDASWRHFLAKLVRPNEEARDYCMRHGYLYYHGIVSHILPCSFFFLSTGKFPFKYIGTEGDLQLRFFYALKERLFPFVYWKLWTRGMWYGTNGPIKPSVVMKEDANAQRVVGTSSRK